MVAPGGPSQDRRFARQIATMAIGDVARGSLLLLRGAETTIDASAMSPEEHRQYLDARIVVERAAQQLLTLAMGMGEST